MQVIDVTSEKDGEITVKFKTTNAKEAKALFELKGLVELL